MLHVSFVSTNNQERYKEEFSYERFKTMAALALSAAMAGVTDRMFRRDQDRQTLEISD